MSYENLRVCIASPPGYLHALAFKDVAETLCYGLHSLSSSVKPVDINPCYTLSFPEGSSGRALILGSHVLPYFGVHRVPEDAIIYNMEYIPEPEMLGDTPITPHKWHLCQGGKPQYIELLKTCSEIWDYSPHNLDRLRRYGLKMAMRYVPIGYSPYLVKLPLEPMPVISYDAVLIGSICPRRADVIQGIEKAGFRAAMFFNSYGHERDAQLHSSRIVLNVHYYASNLHESVRTSYLLANGHCVVSETSECPHEDAMYEDMMVFTPYERLVETVLELNRDSPRRKEIALRGKQLFSERFAIENILRKHVFERKAQTL
jgi:hypothetical protein